MPKTRIDFWKNKFAKNVSNDKKNSTELTEAGWNVIVLWECEINKYFDKTMMHLVQEITSENDISTINYPVKPTT